MTEITPALRPFLRTESVSASVLIGSIVAGLVWANFDARSYDLVWRTNFSVTLGDVGVAMDLRAWVNSGLMALFFLVVGLEARREIDLGELRDRRRVLIPLLAGAIGTAVPVAIYVAATAGTAGARGWGVAMSTDTALALGLLALVGRGVPDKMRAFLLTVFVVDDFVAIIVIVAVYSHQISLLPLGIAALSFGLFVGGLHLRIDLPPVYFLLGVVIWVALLVGGVDPIVTGLAIGLTAWAYSPTRDDLKQATNLFRLFREQPTSERAWRATTGLISTLSPNERLQRVYRPWTSYVIVPIFALANVGIELDGRVLAHAAKSPVTLGIVLAFVVGKPLGIAGTTWLISVVTDRRIRPPVGWAAVLGSGTIAGIPFTVSLLIADLAFAGPMLVDAKLGVLAAGIFSIVLTWLVFRLISLLSLERRARALQGDANQIVDLVAPVVANRDHIRGPEGSTVTVVEYGDFECPYCGRAETAVRDLLANTDVRFVWRHLPITDVHTHAQLAAEACEAAAAQGAFWPMHDLLLRHQDELQFTDLVRYAEMIGLDSDQFVDDLRSRRYLARVDADAESADLSGVSGTPTFFVDGRRLYGAFNVKDVTDAIATAQARAAAVAQKRRHGGTAPRPG